MSGGTWAYREWQIRDDCDRVAKFLEAVAKSEHIIDWAEAGDTTRRREDGTGAERDLYDLWLATFNEVYGDG